MAIEINRRKFITMLTTLGVFTLFEHCKINSKPLVYFVGDSLTKGTGTSGAAFSYPRQTARLINNIDFKIFGYPGLSAGEYYNQYLPNLIISSRRNVFAVVFFGANDLTDLAVNKVYADIVNVHKFLIGKGVKTIAVPILNRKDRLSPLDFDSKRQSLNRMIKANYKSFATAFVDPASAPEIYDTDAPGNWKYFNKRDEVGLTGVHLTDLGATILAKAVAKELKKVIASN